MDGGKNFCAPRIDFIEYARVTARVTAELKAPSLHHLPSSRLPSIKSSKPLFTPPTMGKTKRPKTKASSHKPYPKTPPPAQSKPPPFSLRKPPKGAKPPPQSPPAHVPFSPTDRILLVGEGDFSFSHSLLTAHGCTHLVATSYDTASALRSKYPQAASNIASLEAEEEEEEEEGCVVRYGVDATKLGRPGVAGGAGGGGGRRSRGGGSIRWCLISRTWAG